MTIADKLRSLLSTGKHFATHELLATRDKDGQPNFRTPAAIDRAVTRLRKTGYPVRKVCWNGPRVAIYWIPEDWLAAKAKADEKAPGTL